MNYIDIILGILLILGAIQGFRNGIITELASILALILGVWGAIRFSYVIGDYLASKFDYQALPIKIVAFIITFILIVIVIHLLAKLLDKLVNLIALGFLNHLAGLVFGIIKAAIICSILLVLIDQADQKSKFIPKEDKEQSRVYEPIRTLVPSLLPFLHLGDTDGRNPFKDHKTNMPQV